MDKQIFITGSSKGLGKAMALYCANLGYNIVLHCNSDLQGAELVKKQIEAGGGYARILQFNVNDRAKCKEILLSDVAENGVYYGIICNAGLVADAPFPMLDGDEWDRVVNTSLNGFYNVLNPLVMEMVSTRKPGRIISISSISGLTGNRGQVNYSAAKAGVIGATKSLALELAKHKITVNCIAPGLIDTGMTKDLNIDAYKKHIPMRRIGQADEVASLAAYLLSDGAAYITRQVISVNGGLF